ncbi:hypothetical protein ACROSR_08805 [Roseovarius tibetensis]|uniref:hypothetical protein n=1 Tax=Roseovarius tibetensis TaxID=2685897 RepID=UPI003D7F82F9
MGISSIDMIGFLSGVAGVVGSLLLVIPTLRSYNSRRADLMAALLTPRVKSATNNSRDVVRRNLQQLVVRERIFNILGIFFIFLSFVFVIIGSMK